eukprot:scaffold14393_cov196-Ochromonas_danica.AAC.1
MDASGRIEGVDEVRDNEEVTPHLEHVVDAMQPLPREEEGNEEEVAANQRDIDTAVNHPSSIQSAAASAVVDPPIVTPMDGGDDGAGDVAIATEAQQLQQLSKQYNLRDRSKLSSWKDRFAYVLTSNLSVQRGIQQLGSPAEDAVRAELEQLHSKGVFKPIRNDRRQIKAIRSHLFLKVKRDGRVKGRMVADGSKQERSMSTSVSSPTVSSEAVFITAAVEAHERRHVVTVDIE